MLIKDKLIKEYPLTKKIECSFECFEIIKRRFVIFYDKKINRENMESLLDVFNNTQNSCFSKKKTLIIATHNANIAVRTFPLKSILKEYHNNEYKTYIGNPFINKLINIKDENDTKDWKEESIKILEGGREAFEERGEIYGNNNS